jgi:hypothetical protein
MIKQLALHDLLRLCSVLFHYGSTLTLPVQNYVSTFIEKDMYL